MTPRCAITILCVLMSMLGAAEPTGDVLYPGVPAFIDWSIVPAKSDTVRAVRTSCGCTVANDFRPYDALAGVARTVQLRYGYATPGDYSVDVTAWGSAPDEPLHKGTFSYRVRDAIAMKDKPTDNPWGRLDLNPSSVPGVWRGERAWVRGPHPRPWATMSCQVADGEVPGWSVEVVPVEDSWLFRAGFEPHGLCGIWATRIKFRFADAAGTPLPYEPRLSLRALISGPVEAQPRTAVIGSMAPGSSTETQIVIQPAEGWQGRPVSVSQETTTEHPGVLATMRMPTDVGAGPWTAGLTVSIAPDALPGKSNGAVVLTCSDGTRLRIPFLVTILPTLPSR